MFRRRTSPPPPGWAQLLTQPDDERQPPVTVGRWTPATSAESASPPRTGSGRHRDPTAGPLPISVPAQLSGPRARPTWWAVLGVAIVLVVAAAIFATRAARAGATATPTPVAPARPTAAAPAPGASAAVGASVPPMSSQARVSGPAQRPTAGVLVVHVVGQVGAPGVVRLPAGARVLDAVRAAGGSVKGADLTRINLARVVTDGEQLVVPARGAPDVSSGPAAARAAGPAAGAATGGGAGPVDLNTATTTALEALPGIGPVLAERIVGWRTRHGRFGTVEELAEVPGIGDRLLDRLRPLVRT